ncbi:unnamed protein product [Tilletia caries]|nr:unnamed protein product [Tilletia caries]
MVNCGGELRSAEPTKPSELVEDEQIPWDDWLYVIDKWVETMETEDIGKMTRRAWNSFNDQVRKHMDRHEPLVQQALKILHGWQRHCFAHDTRQEKTRRKRIKRNDDLAPDQKEKKLDELRKFDPSAWPKKNFKRIKKDLKKKKDLAIEKEIKDIKASTAGQSSSSSKKGPSQQPAAGPSGSEPQKPSLFGTTLSKARTPAPDTFAVTNAYGHCIRREGGKRICHGYNLGSCSFPA